MSDRRIAYSKDKEDIIQALRSGEETTGPFSLIAEVLVFAAALGARRNRLEPLTEPLAEPIRQSVFDSRGYDTMMNLIALHADPRAETLADSPEAIEFRAQTFEQFANGGLEILRAETRGARDVLEHVVLMLNAERKASTDDSGVFEIDQLLN
jgi:dnd system-associated protein 4